MSLVPSLTELLADLGLDSEVVGLTTFCIRPKGWRESKTRVGGTKDVRINRVRELDPDLILANKEENTPEDVAALSEIAPVYVTDISDLDQALEAIESIGDLVDRAARARDLSTQIRCGFEDLANATPFRTAYLIWRDPFITVGGDTFIGDVMRRNQWINVFSDRARYPVVSVEDLLQAQPEVVLLSSEPFPFNEKHLDEIRCSIPGAIVLLACGEAFSWYGSRLLETPRVLAALRKRVTALAEMGSGVDSRSGELR